MLKTTQRGLRSIKVDEGESMRDIFFKMHAGCAFGWSAGGGAEIPIITEK